MKWIVRRVEAWVKQQEAVLLAKYEPLLKSMEDSLAQMAIRAQKRQDDAEEEFRYLEERLTDRRMDLLKAEDELKAQIRLLEAKAKPDSVWLTAYTAGFDKAMDLLPEFSAIIRSKIEQKAIDGTLERLGKNGH